MKIYKYKYCIIGVSKILHIFNINTKNLHLK